MTDNEPEVEIVDRKPPPRREKFSYKQLFLALSARPVVDSRLFRFGLLFIIFVGIFDVSPTAGYIIGASVYGWTSVDRTIIYLRHIIPKRFYLLFTLKGAVYIILLVITIRFLLGILLGWILMPLVLGIRLFLDINKK